MCSMSNINPWPPTVPAGTTAQSELIGGGTGLAARKGGGDTADCVNAQYALDKAPDDSYRWVAIRWNDDRKNTWSKEHVLSLGKIGPSPLVLKTPRLGMYKTRQWEIVAQSDVPLIIFSVEEEVD